MKFVYDGDDTIKANQAAEAPNEAQHRLIIQLLAKERYQKYLLAYRLNAQLGLRVCDLLSLRIDECEALIAEQPKYFRFVEGKTRRRIETHNEAVRNYRSAGPLQRLIINATTRGKISSAVLKDPKIREVPLTKELISTFRACILWAKDRNYRAYLFESDSRNKTMHSEPRPLTATAYWQKLKEIREMLSVHGHELRLSTHSMRKAFATSVFKESGNDIRAASAALGHSSITTTERYIGLQKSEVDRATIAAGKKQESINRKILRNAKK